MDTKVLIVAKIGEDTLVPIPKPDVLTSKYFQASWRCTLN
jgi:hypothetical protein